VPDLLNDVMFQNQTLFRSLPLAAGGFGLVSLLANRILSGVRPLLTTGTSGSSS
jgi:hypothetical protein